MTIRDAAARPGRSGARSHAQAVQLIAGLITTCALVIAAPMASAGKPATAGGGGRPGGGSSTSSVTLVLLDSADTMPNYGEHVTFEVSTTATDRPFVQLDCYQGGTRIYSMSAGFFPDYPFTTTYTLRSSYWTGGDADCTAVLYYRASNGRTTALSRLSFTVAA